MSEDRLNSLLLAWQDQQAHGRELSAVEMCRACPELAEELGKRIDILRRLAALMQPDAVAEAGPARETGAWQTSAALDATGETVDRPARPRPAPIPPPGSVPGYELLEELGRGGMGVVYKARHLSLNRLVALKMLLTGGHSGTAELARFRLEAEAIARVQHPNIVQVHEVGEAEGRPFVALEFCAGGSLAAKLDGTPVLAHEAACLAEVLARAVHAAHERGVVHRDLKPANVLLAADGTPKVSDFGLAKLLDRDQSQTQSGAVLGTPSYMAPEQAQGRKEVGAAADVYALGAMLYELLTGRPPFKAVTALDTVQQVLSEEPVPPRRLQSQVPRDLETVCLKCLRKEPARRYASAAALAQDLQRFQAGEPIAARPSSLWERGVKWARRRPALAALGAVLVAALALVLTGGAWYNARLRDERAKADTALTGEEQARKERALAQIQALQEANPQAVPSILAGLEPVRADVLPRLRQLWAEADRPEARPRLLRVGLALLPTDAGAVKGKLYAGMLQAGDPRELLLLRDALQPYAKEVRDDLWTRADEPQTPPNERFRALVALAAFDRESDRWPQRAEAVLGQLLAANPLHLPAWTEGLRPVRWALLRPLAEVFRGRKSAEQRHVAATVLADYAADRPDLLADLALDADARQYALLLPGLKAHAQVVLPRLRGELARTAPAKATDETRDRLTFRQANAAVTLLHLGEPQRVWQLLEHTPDPSRRTYLTHHLGPYGIAAPVILDRLQAETDVSARRALLLSLGEYAPAQVAAVRRQALVVQLVRDYRDDPDPGIHGASAWLLRRWHEGARLPRLANHRPKAAPPGKPAWFVNGQGQTLTVIPGPVEFLMGSPPSEDGVSADTRHLRKIPRSFAIGTKEVTAAEFRQFLAANPKIGNRFFDSEGRAARTLKRYSPEAGSPVVTVDWRTAAAYCNWLSRQERLPEEEWCYPKGVGESGEGLWLQSGYLKRKGYRLPTEAEWEYACRAWALTRRFYGRSEALLGQYAWYQGNSGDHTHPVGSLRPNDLGMFDMLGNVAEWCLDRDVDVPAAQLRKAREDTEYQGATASLFVYRGGAFSHLAANVRTDARRRRAPAARTTDLGLRVAKTCD